MDRDWQLLERLSKLGDDILIGVEEAAALTGFAPVTIQQRKIKGFPAPIPGPRRLRWRLGEIRAWGRETIPQDSSRRPLKRKGSN